jgi:hypothetical protein
VVGSLFATVNAILANAVGDDDDSHAPMIFIVAVLAGIGAAGVQLLAQTLLQSPQKDSPARVPDRTKATGITAVVASPRESTDPPLGSGTDHLPSVFPGSQRWMGTFRWIFLIGTFWIAVSWPLMLLDNMSGLATLAGLPFAVPFGYGLLMARLQLPKLFVDREGIRVRRSPIQEIAFSWPELEQVKVEDELLLIRLTERAKNLRRRDLARLRKWRNDLYLFYNLRSLETRDIGVMAAIEGHQERR